MLFHEPIIDHERRERNWRQAHTTKLILPITDFFGGKFDIGGLDVIKAGRNVLYLDILSLIRI